MTDNYLNVMPSPSHLCDMARAQQRTANTSMTNAMRSRDRELSKKPADMARASQAQAQYVFHRKIATLMESIKEESCGI